MNLGLLDDGAAVPALVEALRDPHPSVHNMAVWALGRLGDPACVPPLLAHLERQWQEDPYDLSPYGPWALGDLRDPRALDWLEEVVHESTDVGTVESALVAVGRIGGRRGRDLLIETLDHPDENYRARAADALGAMRDRSALNALLADLDDEEPLVVIAAAGALGNLGRREAAPGLRRLAAHPDARVRQEAEYALNRLRRGVEPSPVPSRTPEPGLVAVLDLEDFERSNIVDYNPLGQGPVAFGHPPRTQDLLAALRDPGTRPEQRSNAVLLLGNLKEPSAEVQEALRARLEDDDSGVRWAAAKALGKIGSEGARGALLRMALDSDKDVREDALEALGRLPREGHDARTVAALLAGLDEPWISVRVAAATALGRLGGPRAQDGLRRALADPEPEVRSAAARSVDDAALVPALEVVAAQDPVPYVRRAAAGAVRRLRGDL